MKVIDLISQFGFGVIVIILLIAIPAIVNFIVWCKNLWAKREQFKQDNMKAGRQQLQAEEKEENRFTLGEARIKKLEEMCEELTKMNIAQQKAIDRLTRSDMLAAKTYIKEQHDIWVVKGFIDSQTLDLLEARFAIYEEEGGNSWAGKLMNELRALPTAVIIPELDRDSND